MGDLIKIGYTVQVFFLVPAVVRGVDMVIRPVGRIKWVRQ